MTLRLLGIFLVLLCAYVAVPPRGARADSVPQEAGSIQIHVKGSAQLQVSASTDGQTLTIRGELIDDAGSPIVAAPLTIQIFSPEALSTPVTLPAPSACDTQAHAPRPHAARDEYAIDTDERGGFCVRGGGAVSKGMIRVRFRGTKLHDAAEAQTSLNTAEARAARALLRFEPAIESIDLDRESVPVTASLRVDRSEALADGTTKREGLLVLLEDERGTKIADALTGGDGRARFEVKTSSLAGPGAGELRLRFDGAPGLAKAAMTLPIMRRSEAKLALAHPLDSADPEDGVPIDVEVTWGRGAVHGGVVEALRGVESVGAGGVEGGKALVIASFAVDRAGSIPLTLRYIPAAPWWRAGPELRVDVRIAGPGIGRQILIALVVVVVTAWVIAGWRRAPTPRAPQDGEATAAPLSGRAGVHIVTAGAGQNGWKGVVSDAHDGSPIAGARLSIIVPAFEGDGVTARAFTDAKGAFTIEGTVVTNPSGARLVVDSATYSMYEQALPPPSVLTVALITRRRAMLDRLVRWARRQGAPFDGPPEPTPGHVRRVAARTSVGDVEIWAQKVEQSAFGSGAVDEQVELHLRATEPKGGRS